MAQFSIVSVAPVLNTMPLPPPKPIPLIVRPRRLIASVAPAMTVIPFNPPDTSTPASPTPSLMMLMPLVIVTAPYPPGSRTVISPAVSVLSCARWKVRHGVGRLQSLASLPADETNGRANWASAGVTCRPSASSDERISHEALFVMGVSCLMPQLQPQQE